jgi:hypothetical protein
MICNNLNIFKMHKNEIWKNKTSLISQLVSEIVLIIKCARRWNEESLLPLFEMSKFKEITKKGKTLKLAETQ